MADGTVLTAAGVGKLREDALGVLRAGAAAADAGAAVAGALELDGDILRVGRELSLDLAGLGGVRVIAAGKAAAAMAAPALERLGGRVTGGSVTLPRGSGQPLPPLEVWEAAHPVPDIGSLTAAGDALALARAAGERDLLICLLSGGASSLWAAPAPGLTLGDLQAATTALLRSGAPIEPMNIVRKHLSRIAGGGLALAARPARVLTLAVSDVIGAGIEAIGSGPTLPDPTTFADALEVVRRYAVALPAPALHHLRIGASGAVAETPKPADLDNLVGFRVVLSVREALAGAAAEAHRLGYRVRVVSSELTGEAREVGARVAVEALRARAAGEGPVALLWGGETTVTVRGAGVGGRNQEAALAAAAGLRDEAGVVVAAMGTDGRDGPTEAAGGVVDGGTVRRGAGAGLDAGAALHANDSHAYLRATGDLIVTGPTGTNVNDLVVALVAGAAEAPRPTP